MKIIREINITRQQVLRRSLLVFSGGLFVSPFILNDKFLTYITIPLFYFLGTYFILYNFPSIIDTLHSKPIHYEDLLISYDNNQTFNNKFQKIHNLFMSAILSGLVAYFSEYIIINGFHYRPLIELFGILGGNILLYIKVQHMLGKLLLYTLYFLKKNEVKRRLSDSSRFELHDDEQDGIEIPKKRKLSDVDDEYDENEYDVV